MAQTIIARILKKEGVEILPAFPHSDLIESAAKGRHPSRSSSARSARRSI